MMSRTVLVAGSLILYFLVLPNFALSEEAHQLDFGGNGAASTVFRDRLVDTLVNSGISEGEASKTVAILSDDEIAQRATLHSDIAGEDVPAAAGATLLLMALLILGLYLAIDSLYPKV